MLEFTEILQIDFSKYPPIQVLLLGLGFLFWAVVYIETIRGIKRNNLVEIPIIVCAMDISWEFSWAFLLDNDFGILFTIGCTIWFFLNCFINFGVLIYGKKLVTNLWIKENFYYPYFFIIISSGFITYFFKTSGIDNGLGLISAYLINIVISSTYLYQLISFPHYINNGFKISIGWSKFIGTGAISVFCFLHYPYGYLLQSMCIIVYILDIYYIYLFKTLNSALK